MKTRITSGLFSSRTDEWATPADTFAELDAEFHFNLDPCATAENHKCPRYFTKEDDGLAQNWGGVQCVLQSSLRQGHQGLGAQVQRRGKEARHARGAAHPGQNGHRLLPRLHLPQGPRGALHPWPPALQ